MTNMIRCECGYIARESSREDVLKAARTHLKGFHPEITEDTEKICRVVSEECQDC